MYTTRLHNNSPKTLITSPAYATRNEKEALVREFIIRSVVKEIQKLLPPKRSYPLERETLVAKRVTPP